RSCDSDGDGRGYLASLAIFFMNHLVRSNRLRNGHSVHAVLPSRRAALTAGMNRTNAEPDSIGVLDTLIGSTRLLLLCAISGAMVALLIGWIQTPVYRAQTSLEFERPNG